MKPEKKKPLTGLGDITNFGKKTSTLNDSKLSSTPSEGFVLSIISYLVS